MERIANTPELLDGPLEAGTLAGNLRDLERVNRWLGGAELSWRALAVVLRRRTAECVELLDVGTGAADIPRHLLRRASDGSLRLTVTASDVRPEITDVARTRSRGVEGLDVREATGGVLEFADDSFDIVHASMVLHHLEPEAAVGLLREMARVARRAVIVNDLDRARRWWLGAWLLSRLTTANRYTRHDAPLSVRRAYRAHEMSALAAAAGLSEVERLTDRLGHRYALVLTPG